MKPHAYIIFNFTGGFVDCLPNIKTAVKRISHFNSKYPGEFYIKVYYTDSTSEVETSPAWKWVGNHWRKFPSKAICYPCSYLTEAETCKYDRHICVKYEPEHQI